MRNSNSTTSREHVMTEGAKGGEPMYEVVWPLGRCVSKTVELAPPVVDLNGKTVCELWDWVFRGNEIFPILRAQLKQRYPNVRIVDYETMGDTHGNDEREYVATLPQLLARHGADAVI